MLNLGDSSVYESTKKLILYHLKKNGITSLDLINRIIGTLNVLHRLNQDYEKFVRLGDLILDGQINRDMWKKPKHDDVIEKKDVKKYATEFDFSNEQDFLDWLKELTPNPNGLAPCGYVHGGITSKQKMEFVGDKFDIHLHKGEFISSLEEQEGVVRIATSGSLGNTPGKPLPSWEQAIKNWTQDFIEAVSMANELNIWQEFADGLGSFPCGQGRFWPLEKFVAQLKKEKGYSKSELERITERMISQAHSLPNHVTCAHSTSSSTRPKELTKESLIDTTFKMTGKVPNSAGLCLIADYLSKKHNINIFVIEKGEDVNALLALLANPQMPMTTKIGTLGISSSGHWYAMQIQKKKMNQLEIAVMDSLGDGEHAFSSAYTEVSQLISDFIRRNPNFYRSDLYYNRERMQFDPENCGTFSAVFCKKMLKSRDFVASLKELNALQQPSEPTIEKTEMTHLFTTPPAFYFNQYASIGKNPSEIFDKMKKQSDHVMSARSDVLTDRFVTCEYSQAQENPYYHIYSAVIQHRTKYWDKVERYFAGHTSSNLAKIINKRKVENLSIEDIIKPSVRSQTAPSLKKPTAKATPVRSSFNYRSYLRTCSEAPAPSLAKEYAEDKKRELESPTNSKSKII